VTKKTNKPRSAEFFGTVKNGTLATWTRKQVAAFLSKMPDGDVIIAIAPKGAKRSKPQNDGFHAMITPWARDGGHDITDLKRDLLGTVFGWKDSPLSETRVPIIEHTSDLTVEQFSELMERTVIIAAQLPSPVILTLPSEYRGVA